MDRRSPIPSAPPSGSEMERSETRSPLLADREWKDRKNPISPAPPIGSEMVGSGAPTPPQVDPCFVLLACSALVMSSGVLPTFCSASARSTSCADTRGTPGIAKRVASHRSQTPPQRKCILSCMSARSTMLIYYIVNRPVCQMTGSASCNASWTAARPMHKRTRHAICICCTHRK